LFRPITCVSIVIVLHSLFRATVSALLSLVVLSCDVNLHAVPLFEQIKKEWTKEEATTSIKIHWGNLFVQRKDGCMDRPS